MAMQQRSPRGAQIAVGNVAEASVAKVVSTTLLTEDSTPPQEVQIPHQLRFILRRCPGE
jgi:hypothetical protein